jgi:DNA invertase Pin-like site-specific DNA recombinase
MSQEIGYTRVSKTEQHLALQIDALKKRGVARIFTDKQTGVRFDRKAFLAAIAYLNEGDTLVVWKLDRLGRSVQQLIETLERLKIRNINVVSLTEDVNTSTPTGMLFSNSLRCWRSLSTTSSPSAPKQVLTQPVPEEEQAAGPN